jgi:hypothetical protein
MQQISSFRHSEQDEKIKGKRHYQSSREKAAAVMIADGYIRTST